VRGPALTLAFLVLASAALPGCTTSGRQIEARAYEACKSRPDPKQRALCIAGERERLSLEHETRAQRCLDAIARQEDRAAMRRGERAGDPNTVPADGC
jgi:hypothetical protein